MASLNVETKTQSGIDTLEQQRQDVIREMANLRNDLRNMAEPSADEADVDAYEREKTWALLQTLQRKLDSIDHAIRQAQDGAYGICEGCGERIDPARLEILPATTFCLSCKRKAEMKNRRGMR
jgi:RNA polymerase-binding protein DksA